MKQKIKVKRYNFIQKKLTKPLRILMLADLHNEVYGTKNHDLLLLIKQEQPDMILLPGDMIVCREKACQSNIETAETLAKLAELAPVYYAYGNHERGLEDEIRDTEGNWKQYKQRLEQIEGLHILKNDRVYLKEYNVCITGLDLPRSYYKRFVKKKLTKEALWHYIGRLPETACNILLAHNPDYFRSYCYANPDFILSGHNHGGMVRLPFLGGVVSPRLHPFPKYDYGLYESRDGGSRMIVTSGCGMHSIRIRIHNPKEVVVIEVKDR